jgi:hypothetical protein
VYAQTTYIQENHGFCFQLCTAMRISFVFCLTGFLVPWLSSLAAVFYFGGDSSVGFLAFVFQKVSVTETFSSHPPPPPHQTEGNFVTYSTYWQVA